MSITWSNENDGCCATLSRGPADAGKRKCPRVVVAGGSAFALRVADSFRRQGWQVSMAAIGDDLRKVVRGQKAHAIVLPTELGAESGFLTCAKLIAASPRLKVVLVGTDPAAHAQRFAGFVGATAYVPETDGAGAVLAAATGAQAVVN